MAGIQSLVKLFEEKEAAAREANVARQQKIESMFDKIIARYGTEGTYGAGYEAELGQAKQTAIGAATQRDISRGLYGTTPYEATWEKEVGAPARLKLEDIKTERLSQAELGKAGFMERIEETYPDYGALLQAAQAAATRGGGGGGSMYYPPPDASFGGAGITPTQTTPSPTYARTRTRAAPRRITPAVPSPTYAAPKPTTKTSAEYKQYVSTLRRTQGAKVVQATPSEYQTIQKRLKKLYGSSTGSVTQKSKPKSKPINQVLYGGW